MQWKSLSLLLPGSKECDGLLGQMMSQRTGGDLVEMNKYIAIAEIPENNFLL